MRRLLALALLGVIPGAASTTLARERPDPRSGVGLPSRHGFPPCDRIIPDDVGGPGTCWRLAHYGDSCGAFGLVAADCAPGLVCTARDEYARLVVNPDGPGVCLVREEGRCGGSKELLCEYTTRCSEPSPGLGGICRTTIHGP
jgi:hypothetical protein